MTIYPSACTALSKMHKSTEPLIGKDMKISNDSQRYKQGVQCM